MHPQARRLSEDELITLLDQHADRLRASIASKIPQSLRSLISPEDVLQEAWISVLEAREQYIHLGDGPFRSYVWTTANRILLNAITWHERARRRPQPKHNETGTLRESPFVQLHSGLSIALDTPSREASAHESAHLLDLAIQALPSDDRNLLTLYYVERLPVAEIANRTCKNKNQVLYVLKRCRRNLRIQLGKPSRFFSDA